MTICRIKDYSQSCIEQFYLQIKLYQQWLLIQHPVFCIPAHPESAVTTQSWENLSKKGAIKKIKIKKCIGWAMLIADEWLPTSGLPPKRAIVTFISWQFGMADSIYDYICSSWKWSWHQVGDMAYDMYEDEGRRGDLFMRQVFFSTFSRDRWLDEDHIILWWFSSYLFDEMLKGMIIWWSLSHPML